MFVLFGVLVIIVPQLLSLLVGFLLIFIGGNIVLVNIALKKGKKDSIKFGSYEIFKNKK